MDSISVVLEFPNVFPTNLPRVSPDRDIDFVIDLELSIKSISITPCCMAQIVLKEIKE